MNNKISLSS